MGRTLPLLFLCIALSVAKIYFEETFPQTKIPPRWVNGVGGKRPHGRFGIGRGPHAPPKGREGYGLTTLSDNAYYLISSKFDSDAGNKGTGKPVYFTYSLTNPQTMDCYGGYIKILPKDAFDDQADFVDTSKYNIMIGPDVCIGKNMEFKIILRHNTTNHEYQYKFLLPINDQLSHLYTFGLFPNNTFSVWVDREERLHGSLEESFGILEPKQIPDPAVKKPDDWDDQEEIPNPDPNAGKVPDHIPALVDDPNHHRPKRWDEEKRGPWKPRQITNPDYGKYYVSPTIKNPNFRGKWEPPMIDNPEFVSDPTLFEYDSFMYVGIDVFQVSSGSVFDNFFVSDSFEEVEKFSQRWEEFSEEEKINFINAQVEFDSQKAEL